MTRQHPQIPLPAPRVNVTIRPGVPDDVAFMDALQRKTTKQVGWMPTKQFEGKIAAGHVLVAERVLGHSSLVISEDAAGSAPSSNDQGLMTNDSRVGYLIGNDQYFKRDDVGVIYQINVIPEMRRSLVAASLLKSQFERSAYGCKLYCCWCAQDIAANHFWEAMGFVPLAFRAGSAKKSRTHIFWQKRIRSGDVTTPWWFPSQTSGGALREDRLVLPIPPGVSWRDEMPRVLPKTECGAANSDRQLKALEAATGPAAKCRPFKPKSTPGHPQSTLAVKKAPVVLSGGMRFAAPAPVAAPPAKPEKKPREPQKKRKNDPQLIAAARELRDRWLEGVNAGQFVIESRGKYDAARAIGRAPMAAPLLLVA